jgi:hypothetical protein
MGEVYRAREAPQARGAALLFSPARLKVSGTPFLVVPQGSYPGVGSDGTLVYSENVPSGLNELV